MSTTPTVSDVRQIVQYARYNGQVPDLSHANLRGMDLSCTDLREVTLYRADFSHANLSGAKLYKADLSHANLHGANLHGAKLYDANVFGANLRGANLRGADLYGAKLCEADLREANLFGVNFHHANLSGAKFSGANLHRAILSGAKLYEADLHGANLFGADLYDANLQRVIGWDGLHISNLHPYPIHLTATPEGWSIRIGCWTGTPDELELLISQDDGWPESTGEEIIKNRALLTAALVVIRAHADADPTAISDAVKAHENWK